MHLLGSNVTYKNKNVEVNEGHSAVTLPLFSRSDVILSQGSKLPVMRDKFGRFVPRTGNPESTMAGDKAKSSQATGAMKRRRAMVKNGASSMEEEPRPDPSKNKRRKVLRKPMVESSSSSSEEMVKGGPSDVVPSYDDTMPLDAPPLVMRPPIGSIRKQLDDDLAKFNLSQEGEEAYNALSRGIDYFLKCRERVQADRGSWVLNVRELIQVFNPPFTSTLPDGKTTADPTGTGNTGTGIDKDPATMSSRRTEAEKRRKKRKKKAAKAKLKSTQEQPLAAHQRREGSALPSGRKEATPSLTAKKGLQKDTGRKEKGPGRTSGQKQREEKEEKQKIEGQPCRPPPTREKDRTAVEKVDCSTDPAVMDIAEETKPQRAKRKRGALAATTPEAESGEEETATGDSTPLSKDQVSRVDAKAPPPSTVNRRPEDAPSLASSDHP
ncbi:hypothetical protein EAI_15675 [Harpegnathos saltator]|uniref:Uncharacterized protein n=1 Tax=Harpegnathos saltator TaxID=610380 RepID=E2C0F4_HARSA|nr:hypothetical protein EAI_15675 [Harpegnathos saltator]